MDRHQIHVEYSADTRKYHDQVISLRKEIERLNNSISKQAGGAQAVMLRSADLNSQLKGMKMWQTEAVNMVTSGQRLATSLEKNSLTMTQQKQILKDYRDSAIGARGAVSQLAKEQVRMSRSVVTYYKDAQGMQRAMVSTPTGLNMKDQATAMAVARKEAQIYNKVLLQNAEATINWGKNTQWAGRQIMVGLTVPMVMFGNAAKQVFLDIDKELTRLGKVYGGDVAGASQAAIDAIKQDVSSLGTDLARTWGVAKKETLGLAAEIAATGKEGNDLLVSTEQTMRLSILGEVDRQQAMETTLSLQNAFKLNNEELAQSIDFLNAVENQTSASLQDLSIAIPKAGPVVKSLGGDVKDLAYMMVAMKEGGIDAAEGANALKSGLASLINPSKKTQEVASQLGIDLVGIVEANKGELIPTVLAFQKALEGLEPFRRSQLIETIFGKYQYARITALFENLGKEGSQTQAVLDLMGKSAGELAATADKELKAITESASGRWKQAVESFKAEIAPIGEAVTRVLTFLLNGVSKLLGVFNEMPEPVKFLVEALLGFGAIVGPILMAVGIFGNFMGQMKKGFASIKAAGTGIFERLTGETLATDVATESLIDSQYDEKAALMEINSIIEKQINLLRELAKANGVAAASAQGLANTRMAPVPGAAGRWSEAQVDKDGSGRMLRDFSQESLSKREKALLSVLSLSDPAAAGYAVASRQNALKKGGAGSKSGEVTAQDWMFKSYDQAEQGWRALSREIETNQQHLASMDVGGKEFRESWTRMVNNASESISDPAVRRAFADNFLDMIRMDPKLLAKEGGRIYHRLAGQVTAFRTGEGYQGPQDSSHVVSTSKRIRAGGHAADTVGLAQLLENRLVNRARQGDNMTASEFLNLVRSKSGLASILSYGAASQHQAEGKMIDNRSSDTAKRLEGYITSTGKSVSALINEMIAMQLAFENGAASADDVTRSVTAASRGMKEASAAIAAGAEKAAAAAQANYKKAQQVMSNFDGSSLAKVYSSIVSLESAAQGAASAVTQLSARLQSKIANIGSGNVFTKGGDINKSVQARMYNIGAELRNALRSPSAANMSAADRQSLTVLKAAVDRFNTATAQFTRAAETAKAAGITQKSAADEQLAAAREQLTAAQQEMRDAQMEAANVRDFGSSVDRLVAIEAEESAERMGSDGNLIPGQSEAGRGRRFMNRAEINTSGVGMGAMGVGMITGNEAATQFGMMLTSVSMVTMAFNSLVPAGGRVAIAFEAARVAALNFATSAKANIAANGIGAVAGGGIKGMFMGIGRFIMGAFGPVGLALGAVAAAGMLAKKALDDYSKAMAAERAGGSISDITGVKRNSWDAMTAGKDAAFENGEDEANYRKQFDEDSVAKADTEKALKMETDQRVAWMARKYEQLSETVGEEAARKYIETMAKVLSEKGKGIGGAIAEVLTPDDDAKLDIAKMVMGEEAGDKAGISILAKKRAEFEKMKAELQAEYGSSWEWAAPIDVQEKYRALQAEVNELSASFKMNKNEAFGMGQGFAETVLTAKDMQTGITDLGEGISTLIGMEMSPDGLDNFKKAINEADAGMGEIVKDSTSVEDAFYDVLMASGMLPDNIVMNLRLAGYEETMSYLTALESTIAVTEAQFGQGISIPDNWMTDSANTLGGAMGEKLTAGFVDMQEEPEDVEAAYDKMADGVEASIDRMEEANDAYNDKIEEQIDLLNEQIDVKNEAIEGYEEEINEIQKHIDLINEQAEAKKKSLETAKEEADFYRDRAAAEVEYYDALARGDYVAAAGVKAQMDQADADYEHEQAIQRIDDEAKAATDKEQAKIDAKQAAIDAIQAEIDKIQDSIEAIQKSADAVNKAHEQAMKAKQKELDGINKNRDAAIAAEKKKQEEAQKTAKAVEAATQNMIADEALRLATLNKNQALSEQEINASVGRIEKQLVAAGWSKEKAAAFANDMKAQFKAAYDDIIDLYVAPDYQEFVRSQAAKEAAKKAGTYSSGKPYSAAVVGAHTGEFVKNRYPSNDFGLRADETMRKLQVGEFVVQRRAVNKYGPELFRNLNELKMHTGGIVEGRGATPKGALVSKPVNMGLSNMYRGYQKGLQMAFGDRRLTDAIATKAHSDASARGLVLSGSGPIPVDSGVGTARTASAQAALSRALADASNEVGMCLKEVRQWWRVPAKYGSAAEAWRNSKQKMGKGTPPVSAPVWWTGGSKGYGHVAMYVGNGKIRSTDAAGLGKVGTVPLSKFSGGSLQYQGWTRDINDVSLSLRKGGNILKDNVPAILHRNEKVLNAPLSRNLDEGIKSIRRVPDIIGDTGSGASVVHGDTNFDIVVNAAPGMDANDVANAVFSKVQAKQRRLGYRS